MRDEKGIYSRQQDISFSMCDFKERIKPSSLLRLTSDLAGEDYADRGLPHDRLISEGYVFLVSRVRFNISNSSISEQRVQLITYERRVAGPFCIRDYIIENGGGQQLIAGRSAWILCDPVTRRIHRPASFPYDIQNHEDIHLPVGEPDKLKHPEGMREVACRRVVYSDLDGNGHVNNAVYGDMACDALPMELFERGLREFAINFVKEAKIGDTIAIRTGEDDRRHVVAGYVGDSLCFECEFIFE